tara:strand:+ start:1594 stop:1869 length:276 start_codon:yes stop_codon:yes gene_type:complete
MNSERSKNTVTVRVEYCNGNWEIREFRGMYGDTKTNYKNEDDLPLWVQKAIAVIEISESGELADVGLRIGRTKLPCNFCIYWLKLEEGSYL